MEDMESVTSYDSIKNNPKSLHLLMNQFVHIELIQKRSINGYIHAIDPEGYSIILLEPRGDNYQTILIPGHSILNLSVVDSKPIIKPEEKAIHKSTTDLVERRRKLMSWFKKNQLSVTEKDDEIVLVLKLSNKFVRAMEPAVALASQPVEEIVIKCEVIEISDEEPGLEEPKKKRRKRVTPKSPQACEECGKTFQTGYELKKHKRTHTGERPYMCTTCGKTYTQLGHLSIHSLSHKGIKNFNCNECGASFYRKADLDRHEKIHTGEKPYQCEICSKSFTQKNNLVMHFKMHLGDKPHQCEVCLKRFLTRSKMMLHSKKHEKERKKKEILGHI
ncbi:jg27888 [Pararge aegeria aegeria]|uniref:Jg27888 protein n=3 Tax=Pararge aegeria TaxID=116150 RepID=A0A8S4S3P2_9NEOP|nr:jg27888 [Pararge aegeria aegeria]